MATDDPET